MPFNMKENGCGKQHYVGKHANGGEKDFGHDMKEHHKDKGNTSCFGVQQEKGNKNIIEHTRPTCSIMHPFELTIPRKREDDILNSTTKIRVELEATSQNLFSQFQHRSKQWLKKV